MRDLSDQLRISCEKLSYIVDSTAAPVATLGLSNWVAFQLSMVSEGYEIAGITEDAPNAFATYVQSIPYNVYSIFAIVMVGLIVYTSTSSLVVSATRSRNAETSSVVSRRSPSVISSRERTSWSIAMTIEMSARLPAMRPLSA